MALSDPEPISVRAPVRPDGAPLPPSQEPTSIFRHQGLPMIDALLSNLSPTGQKTPLDGVAYLRLIEHLPLSRAQRAPLRDAGLEAHSAGATTAALGLHGPARILAELPVEADGSVQAEVPAGVPFRVQALDASRMAIGTMHNRWYYTLPGQVLTQGISTSSGVTRYESSCAACHGNADGQPRTPALESPDAVTSASLSLSRFERQNPRFPVAPPAVGAATQIEVDFQRDVQPVLERRCVSCHGQSSPAGDLDLSSAATAHFTRAYESLLRSGSGSGNGRAYVDDGDGRARSSHLVELLTGAELDAPRELATLGTPHPASDPLTAEELLSLTRWIELGATFRAAGDAR